MSMPAFTAEASLYQTSRTYYVAGSLGQPVGIIQPAVQRPIGLPIGSCIRLCGGDPDCITCCVCVTRGGHPYFCCR
jgi:hypothetical protein